MNNQILAGSQTRLWKEYYDDAKLTSFSRFLISILYHSYFILTILRLHPKRTLEAGCGRGFHSVFLSLFEKSSLGIDVDTSLVRLASRVNLKFHGRASFLALDARKTPFEDNEFDVVLSQGVLEHFSDKDMRAFVDEWLRLAPIVVISVPSRNYEMREFGNERLMTIEEYAVIFRNYSLSARYYGLKPIEKGLGIANLLQVYRLFNPWRYKSQILLVIRRSSSGL